LFPHMNVRENVRFGLKMDRVPRDASTERVEEALRLVGLEDFGSRMPAQLSGGQQQRVAVARALVKRPAVLLLDEPLGALDLKLRQRLQIELTQIHRNVGTTFVYVTHDQEEAMSMADRIAVMNDGRIEQLGSPEEVYRRPSSRFVADFIGDSNFFAATVDGGAARLSDGRSVVCNGARTGPATLMVRPEAIVLGAQERSISGQVVQTSFLGSFVRVAVQTPAAEAPVVVALREASAIPQVGDEVSLSWRPGDGTVLEPPECPPRPRSPRRRSHAAACRASARGSCPTSASCPRSCCSASASSSRSGSSSVTRSGRRSTMRSSTTGRSTTTATSSASRATSRRCCGRSASPSRRW